MGHTDMRKGMQGLALLVQQALERNPHGGDLFVFRGRAGSLVKIIWHMWTAPSCKSQVDSFDRIACVHMFGLWMQLLVASA